MAAPLTKLPDPLRDQIETLLMPLHPQRVILFGSYAWGEPTQDSDIDLLVVTDDDFLPTTYEERMQHYLKVSSYLREMRKKVPIDLIVHTKPMHRAFIQMGSLFSKEVMARGKVLYEKGN